jgi:A/G-specific adenine glycosylase
VRKQGRAGSSTGVDERRRVLLLAWYDENARPLPWRRRPTSYRIWVAEVMLQQTRIAVVETAYRRFLERFPTLGSLARAAEEDVLAAWSGLGYYTRARALHAAARQLHESGKRSFPKTWEEAIALPGVGSYTAAAVLSIAWGRPHAAVDGNVIRVLSRLERLGRPGTRGEPHASVADRLLARERPGDWNQAVMELGETICLPRAPLCAQCPLRANCEAHASGNPEDHPPPKKRRATERVGLELAVVRDASGRLLLERGAFEHLDHLWLPPIRRLPAPPAAAHFRHAIVHRIFEVIVVDEKVNARTLARRARVEHGSTVERRIVAPGELASLGRSSLLTKALRHLERIPD